MNSGIYYFLSLLVACISDLYNIFTILLPYCHLKLLFSCKSHPDALRCPDKKKGYQDALRHPDALLVWSGLAGSGWQYKGNGLPSVVQTNKKKRKI